MASPTAVHKLELSQLSPNAIQQETMGKDLDFQKFQLFLSSQFRTDLEGRITGASINRTIEGASTLSVDINDWDRSLLRSGLIGKGLDVQIDGLWFRLTGADKVGDTITITFEDREIAILRTYSKWRIALRSSMTRAEFIYSMIKEVKQFNIPTVIPQLHKVQPIERYSGDLSGIDSVINKNQGIPPDYNSPTPADAHHHSENANKQYITVKSKTADPTQIQMANIIIKVGNDMGASRKVKVVAIMVAITESTLHNLPGGDGDSAGLFQQRPSWGTLLERTDPETSSRLFYAAAIKMSAAEPDVPYWTLAADIQRPREDLRTRYGDARIEAERFVNASGDVGSDTSLPVSGANNMVTQNSADTSYYFYRGKIIDRSGKKIRKPENTWDCVQRLADEVDWRAFFVSGTFYYISEDDLFKQQPFAVINEFDTGIDAMDFNYDGGKGSGSIEITARIGRWLAPPGSVVVVQNMGPVDGRWLVNEFSRPLIGDDRNATITLKKPRPQLPEPVADNKTDLSPTWYPQAVDPINVPTTSDLIDAVLKNPLIQFSNTEETSDIQFGQIYSGVMEFMQWLTGKGYPITVTALKSDHSVETSEGRISAHSVGRAVDMGNYNSSNPETKTVMKLIGLYQAQLGFDQLIGPYPLLCLPKGYYDAQTLAEHKSHIHVGWPISGGAGQ